MTRKPEPIVIDEDLVPGVEALIAAGHYATPEDVLVDALDRLSRSQGHGALVTARDCTLDGNRIPLDQVPHLTNDEIIRIIGPHEAGLEGTSPDLFTWTCERIPLDKLVACNQDGAEPTGGWKAAYQRHLANDERAIKDGNPQYAGRQDWLTEWAVQTEIYPIYLIEDQGQYQMIDGHRRLAGAHWHDVDSVWAFVGRPIAP